MAVKQVGALQSLCLSALLFLFTLSASQIWAADFASSEAMTIVGGGVCAFCFLSLLMAIANLETLLLGEVTISWIEVIIAEVVALLVAVTVHRVCVTTCFLFSGGLLYWLNRQSFLINGAGASIEQVAAAKKKEQKAAAKPAKH